MACIFCEIAEGRRPSRTVYADDQLVAFHDVRPQAPTHVLVVPRRHVTSLLDLEPGDDGLLGAMVRTRARPRPRAGPRASAASAS